MKKLLIIAALIAAGTASAGLAACDKTDESVENGTAEAQATISSEELDAQFNIGESGENVYTNDFFDIKYTGNDDWRLLNEEQLATISSSIKDVLTNEEAKAALESGKTSIIMYAVARDATKNASITVQKHDINNTHEADMDAFLDKTVADLAERLPSQGFTDTEVEKTNLTFCGEPVQGIKIKGKFDVKASDGSDKKEQKEIYETMVYLFKGSYSGCITAASFDKDNTGEVLSLFTKTQ